MTNYPNTELLPFLQFDLTAGEYQELLDSLIAEYRMNTKKRPEYQAILPEYTLAICPFCGVPCRHKIDTYCLQTWSNRISEWYLQQSYGTAMDFPKSPPCEHFFGVHQFINLHGATQLDVKFNFFCTSGEVPYLTKEIITYEEAQPRVVLHGLPVCRIINNQFIPSYTFYFLTYFFEDRQKYLNHYIEVQEALFRQYPDDFWAADLVSRSAYRSAIYELSPACQQGILGWMDLTQPENETVLIGHGLELPEMYQHIPGIHDKLEWGSDSQSFSSSPNI